jgi:hypothetical protein
MSGLAECGGLTDLRCLARVTQQRSADVTHSENGTENGDPLRRGSIIHAKGVPRWVPGGAGDIIHAAGVWGGFLSSAPTARIVRRV